MGVVIGIIVVLLVIGSAIAVAWWNLSARAAPYGDEAERARRKREQAEAEEAENTVVIDDEGAADGEEWPARRRGHGVPMVMDPAAGGREAPDPERTPVEREDAGSGDGGDDGGGDGGGGSD